jgi:hypothetical protein
MEKLEIYLRHSWFRSAYAIAFVIAFLLLSTILESCTDHCEVKQSYIYYEPVYQALDEIRSSVKQQEPVAITSVGKIYVKDNHLFVNQPGKGIHVIDNGDPSHPVVKSFINIPGNYDIAIEGNTLYADSYIDLVTIDISDVGNIRETGRLKNIFDNYNSLGFGVDAERGLMVDLVAKPQVTVSTTDCDAQLQTWGGIYYEDGVAFALTSNFDKSAAIAPGNGSGPGVGGSMARFTIAKNYLYALNSSNIVPIDISSPRQPSAKSPFALTLGIETLFPYSNHLFIGSNSGMYILDISQPEAPAKISTYEHVRSCDPVVVEGNYAYVTLRSGTTCQGFTNQLEVIDIKDLSTPQLLKTYPMTNPHGLGIDNGTLFICDGDDGLKVFDASDISSIDSHELAHYKDIHAYDVIPLNDLLILIGNDGIFQYDYSDKSNIKLLSKINVVQEN